MTRAGIAACSGNDLSRRARALLLRLPVSIVIFACVLLGLTGCGSPPTVRTTFLTSVDLVEMTDQMARSLVVSPAVRERNAASQPWVISMHRIINHTNQIIPEREKWLYIGRLRAVLGATAFAHERGLIWVMPPHRWRLVQDELGPEPPELRTRPTHELTAEFTSITTTSAHGRSDSYLCEYELIDLADGRLVWTDHWEVKRTIHGTTYD